MDDKILNIREGCILIDECYPRYQIHPSGHVYSVERQTYTKQNRWVRIKSIEVKQYCDDSSSPIVNLFDGIRYHRHRVDELILKYFRGVETTSRILHADNDKWNCSVDNLTVEDISLEGEKWKYIPNTDDSYMISNLGRVKACPRMIEYCDGRSFRRPEFIMKLIEFSDGYLYSYIQYHHERLDDSVHRLVAKAFLPNPDNLEEVNHKNGNKQDNRVSNLEWCSRTQNRRHAIVSGLSGDNKPVRCIEDNKEFYSLNEAAEYYNVDSTTISRYICPAEFDVGPLGKHFEYMTVYASPISVSDIDNSGFSRTTNRSTESSNNRPIQVKCIETGQIFESYSAAARWLRASAIEVSRVVNTDKIIHGYHFTTDLLECRISDESADGEIWKPIERFGRVILMSNKMRVKSISREVLYGGRKRIKPEKILVPHGNQIQVSVDGKYHSINVREEHHKLFKSL